MPAFNLIPFPANELPNINISGEIERNNNLLSIRFDIQGEIESITYPKPSSAPSRKDDLWKATCFEFFIAIQDQPSYWEFNMSPSGNWNVYVMDAYRQVNMREEPAFDQLPFEFSTKDDRLSLTLSLDITPIIQLSQIVQVGITTIVQEKNNNESYWALSHPGAQADFHIRESFNVLLATTNQIK